MEKKFKKIKDTVNRFHELQRIHIGEFDKSQLPDLEQQSKERSIEVNKLLKGINEFVKLAQNKQDPAAESMLTFLNNKVTRLLDQNMELEAKVKAFKENIKKEMKQVSKGTHAIRSYKTYTSVMNNPKVISLTN